MSARHHRPGPIWRFQMRSMSSPPRAPSPYPPLVPLGVARAVHGYLYGWAIDVDHGFGLVERGQDRLGVRPTLLAIGLVVATLGSHRRGLAELKAGQGVRTTDLLSSCRPRSATLLTEPWLG